MRLGGTHCSIRGFVMALALPTLAPAALAANAQEICELLTPADFTAAGVTGTTPAEAVTDEYGGVFCVYAGRSAGTGGVEFDLFRRTTPAEDEQLWENVASFAHDSTATRESLPGSEDLRLSLAVGSPPYAAIAVKTATLVFTIGVPPGPGAEKALLELARSVIKRASAL
jgi:hypothetical protein